MVDLCNKFKSFSRIVQQEKAIAFQKISLNYFLKQ